MTRRAQSSVVGVALLLGATVVSLGLLTASAGVAVESGLAAADADGAEETLTAVVAPGAPGREEERLAFARGELRVVPRTVRLLNDSGVVERREVGGLAFESEGRRVAAVAGGVVRGRGDGARFVREPPTAADEGAIVASVVRLNASGAGAVSGSESATTAARLRTNVTRSRQRLPPDEYRLAVETAAPTPWERHFGRQGAETARRDFDGDGVESVVARYPGNRTAHLAVTDLRLRMEATGG